MFRKEMNFLTGKPFIHSMLCPKNLFGLFLTLRVISTFCKVIFGDPPKIPFKTSVKLTSLWLFLTLQGYFCLARQKVKNNPKKGFLGYSDRKLIRRIIFNTAGSFG